jgi:hypothetical protein
LLDILRQITRLRRHAALYQIALEKPA